MEVERLDPKALKDVRRRTKHDEVGALRSTKKARCWSAGNPARENRSDHGEVTVAPRKGVAACQSGL
jgi:hypothetical protein